MDNFAVCVWMCIINLCLYNTVHGQNPEITKAILPDVEKVGTRGQLTCVVINQMDNPVQWMHKASQLLISSNDKIMLEPRHNEVVDGYPKYQIEVDNVGDERHFTIIINRLEFLDAGFYTCQILVRGSAEIPAKDGEIVVLVPPAIEYSKSTQTVSVDEGNSVDMKCAATGYPTPNMTWCRVDAGLLPNGQLRYQNNTMTIPQVKAEDRGIYRCLADNAVRPPSYIDCRLIVFFRPRAKAIQTTYGQAENRQFNLIIECRIAGLPEPDLQWYKVTSANTWDPILTDAKHTINVLLNHANILESNERWFQMIIINVQAGDYGTYVCEGRNSFGNGSAFIDVFATYECQGANCPPEGGHTSIAPRLSPDGFLLGVMTALCLLILSASWHRLRTAHY